MQASKFTVASVSRLLLLTALSLVGNALQAQTDVAAPKDTTVPAVEAEEDYSQYDNVGFAAEGSKRYCSPKIEGLSPAKLISIGYDYQMGYHMNADTIRSLKQPYSMPDSAHVMTSNGLRFGCNIPVISRTDLVWQMGANYWEQRYKFEQPDQLQNPMLRSLSENGLRTMGINTTVFKPLNDVKFLLFQGSADLSELNYIPIIFYNSTDVANKWGTEILFPARAHVRRTINSRNMLFAGYELEGQSYRLWRGGDAASGNLRNEDLEIRRGEIRLRMVYEFSLKDFLWMSIQAGYRINYRYDVDRLQDGKEVYRAFGLASDAPYVMVNQLTNPLYFNISLNLVSP